MQQIAAGEWTPRMRDLRDRIDRHDVEAAGPFDFNRRLARDKGWTERFTRSAIMEYRRFCFIAVTGSSPATPSEEVDEVWHQHLTYSRDYWYVWCNYVLRTPLYHDPTTGGSAEQVRFREQYAATLARYESHFGPPRNSTGPRRTSGLAGCRGSGLSTRGGRSRCRVRSRCGTGSAGGTRSNDIQSARLAGRSVPDALRGGRRVGRFDSLRGNS